MCTLSIFMLHWSWMLIWNDLEWSLLTNYWYKDALDYIETCLVIITRFIQKCTGLDIVRIWGRVGFFLGLFSKMTYPRWIEYTDQLQGLLRDITFVFFTKFLFKSSNIGNCWNYHSLSFHMTTHLFVWLEVPEGSQSGIHDSSLKMIRDHPVLYPNQPDTEQHK